jgi:riboflavin transporter FmnP
MSKKLTKSYLIVTIAIMSALAIVFDILSDTLPLRVPWGMKIDFVGTVWVLSYFLYGLAVAFPISVITTLYITFFMPTSFVGGAMKFIATLPMFLILDLISYLPFFSDRSSKIFNKPLMIIGAAILANAVRLLVTIIVNYYWAIPLWTGIPTGKILDVMFGGSVLAFITYIAGLNVLQGIIDILVPWFLAFKFRLSTMFGTW